MTQNSAVAPFSHDAGDIGVLMCHGFTGSPASLRPWAEFMARHGYSVRLPLLPGHGTSLSELNRTTWRQWYDEDRAALEQLRSRCDRVFVFGLSMGGTLSLRLAQEYGSDVSGIALVNAFTHSDDPRAPLAKVLQYVIPKLPAIGNDIKKPGMNEHCYDGIPVRAFVQLQEMARLTRADIAKVTQPTLMFVSREDHVVDASNAMWLAENIPAEDKSSIILEDSYHVATLDNDAEKIFDSSLAFVRRLTA